MRQCVQTIEQKISTGGSSLNLPEKSRETSIICVHLQYVGKIYLENNLGDEMGGKGTTIIFELQEIADEYDGKWRGWWMKLLS